MRARSMRRRRLMKQVEQTRLTMQTSLTRLSQHPSNRVGLPRKTMMFRMAWRMANE